MGKEGARLTGTAVEVAAVLVEELTPLGFITSKKMFGGVGVFGDQKMFLIVDSQGSVFLKADASTSPQFERRGGEKHGRMPYWSVPTEILADPATFAVWAQRARDLAAGASQKA